MSGVTTAIGDPKNDSLLTPQNTVLALIDGLVRHRGGAAFTPGMEV